MVSLLSNHLLAAEAEASFIIGAGGIDEYKD